MTKLTSAQVNAAGSTLKSKLNGYFLSISAHVKHSCHCETSRTQAATCSRASANVNCLSSREVTGKYFANSPNAWSNSLNLRPSNAAQTIVSDCPPSRHRSICQQVRSTSDIAAPLASAMDVRLAVFSASMTMLKCCGLNTQSSAGCFSVGNVRP